MRYHHIGIPTTEPHQGEAYLEGYGVWVTSSDANPYGIEWLRFEPACTLPELVKTQPHVAFEVDDLEEALLGKEVIIEPSTVLGVMGLIGACTGSAFLVARTIWSASTRSFRRRLSALMDATSGAVNDALTPPDYMEDHE